MSTQPCECALLGKGRFYIDRYTAADQLGYRFFGAVTSAQVTAEVEEIEVPDPTQPGGGNCVSKKRYSSLSLVMNNIDLCADNIGILTAASVTDDATGAGPTTIVAPSTGVTGELHDAWPNQYILVDHVQLANDVMVVTETAGGTTLTLGTDYELVTGGIRILAGGAIAAKAEVSINYAAVPAKVIEPATTTGHTFRMRFVGENEMHDDYAKMLGWFHRLTFTPGTLDLIQNGTDVASPEYNAELLSDSGQSSGTNLSRFYRLKQEPYHA